MKESWHWIYEDLEKLIGQAESINLDFKESKLFQEQREKIADNLTREVSAFANTEGGTIVIGIKEKREGKTRVAASIDEGVDIHQWSPEMVQQIIEANLRPYLTGIRVKTIPVNPEKTRCAYVIHVPQGQTAYQAKDHCYYGRSEYESKSLPDHEIRLRMFRGRIPHATVQTTEYQKALCEIPSEELKKALEDEDFREQFDVARFLKDTQFLDYLKKNESKQTVIIRSYHFAIVLKNLGEMDITEFKLKVDFPADNPFYQKSYTKVIKEGWLPHGRKKTIGLATAIAGRMQVNIYPQDTFGIQMQEFFCAQDYQPSLEPLKFKWTLYLSNTLPTQGTIEIPDFGEFPHKIQ